MTTNRPLMSKPRLQTIYTHRHFLEGETGAPLRCKVTRIASGVAYYRAYYGLHDDGSEWLGTPSYIPLEKFWLSFNQHSIQERLDAKSIPLVWTGCRVWLGQTWRGYGKIFANGTTRAVHRVAYELAKGPIPEGLEINHICRVKSCINPAHLEAVSHGENIRYDFAIKPWGNQNGALLRELEES